MWGTMPGIVPATTTQCTMQQEKHIFSTRGRQKLLLSLPKVMLEREESWLIKKLHMSITGMSLNSIFYFAFSP